MGKGQEMTKPWYVCAYGVTNSMKQMLSCCLWSEVKATMECQNDIYTPPQEIQLSGSQAALGHSR